MSIALAFAFKNTNLFSKSSNPVNKKATQQIQCPLYLLMYEILKSKKVY